MRDGDLANQLAALVDAGVQLVAQSDFYRAFSSTSRRHLRARAFAVSSSAASCLP